MPYIVPQPCLLYGEPDCSGLILKLLVVRNPMGQKVIFCLKEPIVLKISQEKLQTFLSSTQKKYFSFIKISKYFGAMS